MKIKLIALDLDGTTLRSKSVLSEETKDTLEAAIKKGVHVVVATGRTFTALPEQIFDIDGLEYIITSNGAYITRLKDKKVIYENYLEPEGAVRMHSLLSRFRQFPIEVFTQGRAYIDRQVFDDVKKNGSDYMDAAYIVRTRTPVENVYDLLLNKKEKIENINIHFRDFRDTEVMKELLEKEKDITVTSSMPHNLEIGGKTTSKAQAVAALCRILKIEEEDVMAAGDSPNDGAMIKAAGLGVAMGNAVDEIKEMADFVTLTNEEDGVAFAVRKFVL